MHTVDVFKISIDYVHDKTILCMYVHTSAVEGIDIRQLVTLRPEDYN